MVDKLRSSVKIYSGGTAVVTREHAIPKGGPLKLSIPVKKRDLDAVVTSLSVLGNVTLPEPPSYQPSNINPTELNLDASNVTKDLATKLRGARVKITAADQSDLCGILGGIQEYSESLPIGNAKVHRWRVVVFLEGGEIKTVDDRNIQSFTFTDEKDRREIEKALHRAYQQIKPDSSFVDLTIVPSNGDVDKCAVSYTTTAPAPKTRYQLRQLRGKWELEAQAVVTNDTEEDWRSPDGGGVFVTVITGEPIDFDTDFSEVSRPRRSKQNLASDSVLGAVGVEEATLESFHAEVAVVGAPMGAGGAGPRNKLSKRGRGRNFSSPEAVLIGSRDDFDAEYGGVRAQQQQAEIREVGDFTVFDCPDPVIIGSNKSAIVPLKTWQVMDVTPILVFKENRHPKRPWRAEKFKNDTGTTLGKGVVTVYQENDFTGKAVLESAQKDEEAILIHALENGVKIHKEQGLTESRRVRINIKEGAIVCEAVSKTEAQYKVQNKKNEDFKLEIEHARVLQDSKFEATTSNDTPVKTTPTVTGARFGVELRAHENVVVVVRETSVDQQLAVLQGAGGAMWLQQNIISIKHPLASNKNVQQCIAVQGEVDQVRQAVQDAEYQMAGIAEEQERLKGIIPVTHDNTANDLKTDVGTNEKKWRALKRETIPALKNALREKEVALQDALTSLTVSWSEEGKGVGEPPTKQGNG